MKISLKALRSFLIVWKGVIMTPSSQQPVTRARCERGQAWSPPPQLMLGRGGASVGVSNGPSHNSWDAGVTTRQICQWIRYVMKCEKMWCDVTCDHGTVWHPCFGEVAEVSARLCVEPRYTRQDSPESSRLVYEPLTFRSTYNKKVIIER